MSADTSSSPRQATGSPRGDDEQLLDWAAVTGAVSGWWQGLRAADRAAALLVTLHLVPVAWLVAGGGLYLDDVRAQAYARGRTLWPFVIQSNGTHLAPGARLVDWLQATYAPLAQWPATLLSLLVHAALGVVLWLLLRELVGPRPAALLPLGVGLLAPAVVPMTAWFRQLLTTGTATVCALALVLLAVRYARRPRPGVALGCVAVLLLGLCFSERTLAAVPAAVLVAWALRRADTGRRRRTASAGVLAGVLALPCVGYLLVYSQGSYDQGHTGGLSPVDAVALVWRAVVLDVVPALVGGPVRWTASGPAMSAVRPSWPVVVLAWLLVLLVVQRLVARHGWRRVLGPATVAAAYVLPVLAMVFVGRYAAFGTATGDDLRLYGDCAVALVVAAAVAWLGLRPAGGAEPAGGDRVRRRPRHRGRLAGVAVAAVLAVVASTVSWATFAHRWHANATGRYLATLDAQLDRLAALPGDPPTAVVRSAIPDEVIPGWMQAEISTDDLVLLTHPHQQTSVADGHLLSLDGQGRLVSARTVVLGSTGRPATGFCGRSVPAGPGAPVSIRLTSRVPYYRDMVLSVQVITLDTLTPQVDVVDGSGRVLPATPLSTPHLDRGPHTVLLPVPYGTDVVGLQVHRGASRFCVPEASVVGLGDLS